MRCIQILAFLILILFFPSCDFISEAVLINKTSDKLEVFITGQPIDNLNKMELIESLGSHHRYRLPAGESEILFYTINSDLDTSYIHFDTMIIISVKDTIELFGKEEIFQRFEEETKYYYTLEV